MKKNILLIVTIFSGVLLFTKNTFGQTYNVVRNWTAQKPIVNEVDIVSASRTVNEVVQTTQYMDGFGRPIQSVAKQTSPLQKDVVNIHAYNTMGREVQRFLPFVSTVTTGGDITNDGNYKPTGAAQQLAFNQGLYPGEGTFYYGQVNLENSPMNRTLSSYSPGSNWVGSTRGQSIQYLVNTTIDNVQMWTIGLGRGSLPTTAGAYPMGRLYKMISKNEKNLQVIEYKDKEGNIVLKKVQVSAAADNGTGSAHSGWMCTYYVFDDYGNRRFIITPKVVAAIDGSWTISQPLADELCYRFEYDLLDREVVKKNPGTPSGSLGEEWTVYDQRGRVVMTQDGNQRSQQKWQYYKYDNLDRVTGIGLMLDPTNYLNLNYHQTNAASASINPSYPNLASYTTESLTETYYDGYTWAAGAGLGSSLDAANVSNTAYFYSPSNSTAPYPQAISQTNKTRGFVTGSKTEVLGTAGSQYLYTVSFYDAKGRVLQAQATNLTGGVDKVTTQYNWAGTPLRVLEEHNKSTGITQSHKILTKMNYGHLSRLQSVSKTISSTINTTPTATTVVGVEKTIASYTYNELGQVKAKSLGTHPISGSPLETIDFDYNVRGWLTGINKVFTQTGNNTKYFGEEIGYDKSTTSNGTTTYAAPAYNGNASGQIWKSKGDGIARKYDFAYDNLSQLTNAGYLQNTNGAAWDKTYIDYSVNSMGYDLNGNVSNLNQSGFALGGSNTIDNLSYNYLNNGNRLGNVIDNANNPQSKLGDFHYTGTKTIASVDYGYDANGNQTSDFNRNIAAISYNTLNLPSLITVTGKGNITYTYDAAGNKLKKIIQENNAVVPYNGSNYATNITTTTTYIGQFVYEAKAYSNPSLSVLNKTEALSYLAHEEGRARLVYPLYGQPVYYAYDYFISDHLGNVRATLTDEQQQDTYPAATVEPGAVATEQTFYNITNDANHVVTMSTLPWWSTVTNATYANNNGIPTPPNTTTNPNANSATMYKLNGATGDRFGMGVALKVMAGDVISVFGKSVWHNNGGGINNTSYGVSNILSTFINAFAGTSTVLNGSKGAATGATLNGNPATTGNLPTVLNALPNPGVSTPKAYINWILFDEQFKPVQSGGGFDPINVAADAVKAHSITGISITKSGYLYVYCSNESNQDVYFDNLQVIHNRGQLLEEKHYYPYGLSMFSLSSRAHAKLQTNFGYQGKEQQSGEFYDGTGLDEYDFDARYYDPQLGRWWAQDPANQFSSPYSAMGNNPVINGDPDGKFVWALVAIGAVIGGVSQGIKYEMDGKNFLDGFWRGAIVGAVGGALGQFGGGSFVGQVIWGAGQGAITGGLGSALNGGNFWDGALRGAAWGAAFAAVTSTVESIKNSKEGYGFGTNTGRLNKMAREYRSSVGTPNEAVIANRAIGFAQKRFGMNGVSMTYDPAEPDFGSTDLPTGDISIGPAAYKNGSYLKATMVHEYGHSVYDRVIDATGNWSWKYNSSNWSSANPTINVDGPVGYSMEIANAGRLHLTPGTLGSGDNPLWSNYSMYLDMRNNNFLNFKWLYLIPQRFQQTIIYKPW